MKKIELTQTSDSICSITIVTSIFWVLLMVWIFLVFMSEVIIVLAFIVPIFLIAVTIYCMNKKDVVEYGAEKIQVKWMRFTRTVKFSEIRYVHYRIIHTQGRYGCSHRFEIVFTINGGKRLRLHEHLTAEDIDNCINGTPENIQLMQLYKFIENLYPEKSRGFF